MLDIKADFWKDYRKVTGSLRWRLATPDDLPRIRRIKNVSERFLNQKQKNLPLFDPPVLLTLVAENAQGRIMDVIYVEAQVEICKVGCFESSFEETAGLEADLSAWLKGIGFKKVLINTNISLKDRMGKLLGNLGFNCEDGIFSRWTRNL